jgi:pyruvate carboxylase subunit B
VIEAMKMQNRLQSPISGTVAQVYVRDGDDVKPDETLVQIT